MTLDDLTTVLYECAGEADMPLGGDILDTDFADLGYDSVSLLEAAGRLQTRFGVTLADDALVQATTPRALLGLVNNAVGDGF
ncbi:acyl carrier protein [Amycolatopsis sp. NPDC059027]|uniref:acyl carrier protein n=1 Tax=unclassified Amycolatopsis TaxID=2618356 RepID=UPI00366E0B58